MLKGLGYGDVTLWTERALNLHNYQYHGPDPDMALSRFRDSNEAAFIALELVSVIVDMVGNLKGRVKWTQELEDAYNGLIKALDDAKARMRSMD